MFKYHIFKEHAAKRTYNLYTQQNFNRKKENPEKVPGTQELPPHLLKNGYFWRLFKKEIKTMPYKLDPKVRGTNLQL